MAPPGGRGGLSPALRGAQGPIPLNRKIHAAMRAGPGREWHPCPHRARERRPGSHTTLVRDAPRRRWGGEILVEWRVRSLLA